jgi:hypothetical protein
MWDECDQICNNLINSYSCECKANYSLMQNGHCKHLTSIFFYLFIYIKMKQGLNNKGYIYFINNPQQFQN